MIITDEKILRTPCSPVLEKDIGELKSLLDNELQRSAILGSPGIGLSLPQIGIFQTMAIVRVDNDHYVDLVNCKITAGFDKEIFDQEGCLSFPDRFEKTLRYQEILIESNAVYPHRFVCTGLMAVVAQHETDHLIGRLLSDVALPKLRSTAKKQRQNDLCECGSNKKYKKCCGKY